jgi:hypothetical protein
MSNPGNLSGPMEVYVAIRGNFDTVRLSSAWVPEISSITAISYAPAQLFEHFIGRQFRAVPHAMTLLQVKQFSLLPATSILCVLETTPWRIMESENLQISVSDTDHFDKLVRQTQNIKSVVKNMNSRPRKGKEPENDEEEGD